MAQGFVGFKVSKGSFFDRRAVIAALKPAERRYLAKAGGLTRSIARRSIKKKGSARKPPRKFTSTGKVSSAWLRWKEEIRQRPSSPPGQPPFTHGGFLREAIAFGFDFNRQAVVIGPQAEGAGRGIAAFFRTHEFGGKFRARDYPARPFMRPALEKAVPKLPELWRQAIR